MPATARSGLFQKERAHMVADLGFDPDSLTLPARHFIDGQLLDDPRADRIPVQRPSDRKVAGEIPLADADLVDRAVRSACGALKTCGWARRAPRERARVLMRWAALVDSHHEEISQLESVVSTRLIGEARGRDVRVCAEVIRYFAEWADKSEGQVMGSPAEALSFVLQEPYGVVAAIVPWNFPLILAAWKFAPALAAGNAVVLKPSELTPFSILKVAELGVEAGLPPGLFTVVQGTGATGQALATHPDVALVTFTGSTATGARILADVAPSMKPVTLELGGKAPQLVFADAEADLDRIADLVTRGFTINAGQACYAGSRLVVQRAIKDALLSRILDRVSRLQPGATWDPAATLAPVANERQCARIADIVRSAVAAGASALTGGGVLQPPIGGCFYDATILDGVSTTSPAFLEEIFGPVLAVQTFDDEDEGLALADHPTYGLTASVFTASIDRALRAVRALQAGTVWVNNFGRGDDMALPFGGYKRSGLGREMGRIGYEKYLKTKSVWVQFNPTTA